MLLPGSPCKQKGGIPGAARVSWQASTGLMCRQAAGEVPTQRCTPQAVDFQVQMTEFKGSESTVEMKEERKRQD